MLSLYTSTYCTDILQMQTGVLPNRISITPYARSLSTVNFSLGPRQLGDAAAEKLIDLRCRFMVAGEHAAGARWEAPGEAGMIQQLLGETLR